MLLLVFNKPLGIPDKCGQVIVLVCEDFAAKLPQALHPDCGVYLEPFMSLRDIYTTCSDNSFVHSGPILWLSEDICSYLPTLPSSAGL